LQPDDPGLDRDMLDVLIEKKKMAMPSGRIEETSNLIEDDSEFEYIPSRD
jgi:hypothetical protein